MAGQTNLGFLKSLGRGHEFDPSTVAGEPRARVLTYVRQPDLSGAGQADEISVALGELNVNGSVGVSTAKPNPGIGLGSCCGFDSGTQLLHTYQLYMIAPS